MTEGEHMTNEVLQWAALASIGFLLMGVFRYIAARSPVPPSANTYGGPPLGARLSKRAMSDLEALVPGGVSADGVLLAFVVESCTGCQTLLGQIAESRALQQGQQIALVTRSPTKQFREAVASTGLPVVLDGGALWDECRVTNTPLVLKVDADGKVSAKGVTHHVDTVALPA
jgi:hypothetical protein